MDDLDRASHIETWQRDMALAEFKRRHPQPKQIMVNGKVVCMDCEEPICEKRLAGLPHAARCIDCQQDADKEQRRGR